MKRTLLNTLTKFKNALGLFLKVIQGKLTNTLDILSGISVFSIIVLLILEFGFHLADHNKLFFAQLHLYLFVYFMIDVILRLIFHKKRVGYFLRRPTDVCIFFPVLFFLPQWSFLPFFLLAQMALLGIMVGRLVHLKQFLVALKIKPAQLFLFGFLFTIFLGSLLLSLPIATVSPIPYTDALFTSFSSVCVTGLVVNDIGNTFSFFGHMVILILIQIGGLGMMTFSVFLSLIMNRRISQADSQEIQESYATHNLSETFHAIGFILRLTILIEGVGALILFLLWRSHFDSLSEATFYSVFHSISAFCNAGFSLFSTNLMGFEINVPIMLTVSSLIIVGGLGFPVILNLIQNFKKRQRLHRLRLHTKLALAVTGCLIFIGTFFIYIGEADRSLSELTVVQKVSVSFFQSVSARTAGFNVVDLSSFHASTLLIMMILMIIGASPGSTGGGIKTTTFGLMIVSFWHTLKASKRMVVSNRTINRDNVLRAFLVLMLAILIIMLFFYILLQVENAPYLSTLFEVISAFGTVGYSLGLTETLSNVGKFLIMVLMFIGRIGPLSMALALSRRRSEAAYAYPEEKVYIA